MNSHLRFLCDEHIRDTVVKQLRLKGVEIIHCVEVDLRETPDTVIFEYAIQNGYVIVTCDEDFVNLHYQYLSEERNHSGVVFFRMAQTCKSISRVVKEIWEIHQMAQHEHELVNQLWEVKK